MFKCKCQLLHLINMYLYMVLPLHYKSMHLYVNVKLIACFRFHFSPSVLESFSSKESLIEINERINIKRLITNQVLNIFESIVKYFYFFPRFPDYIFFKQYFSIKLEKSSLWGESSTPNHFTLGNCKIEKI